MINNDDGGRPTGIGIAGFDELKPFLAPVADRIGVAGEDLKPFQVTVGKPSWGSDVFPFAAQGIPAIGISTEPIHPEDWLYGHTHADTTDKVYRQGLNECAGINAQIVFHIANMSTRPARRKTQEEVEELFDRYNYAETLELLDMWPPGHVRRRYFSSIDSHV